MNVKEIVQKYLAEHGFAGLAGNDCGCGADDLMPCDNVSYDCVTAKRKLCINCHTVDCEFRNESDGCFVAVREIEK